MSDPVTIALLELTTDIVSSFVSNNMVSSSELPSLISLVHGKLNELQSGSPATEERVEAPKPAVNPKKSITEDYIICLEDGQRFKSLRRHLRTHYNMSPEDYREKWGLAPDYPMVAPAYRAQRSALAKTLGLGRKPGEKPARTSRKKTS
ncbi:MucR family transcriptional regulator [Ochrobactrum sp. Kaboul]|nr:MucR family transcriptional regulator [Ochrobactrum sp. Kaboul]